MAALCPPIPLLGTGPRPAVRMDVLFFNPGEQSQKLHTDAAELYLRFVKGILKMN